jgi:hypothetical protein
MDLYVCWGTMHLPSGHPCAKAHDALKAAGHYPRVIRSYGWNKLPGIANRTSGRNQVKERTGRIDVPVLVTDDDEAIYPSSKIIEWAEAHPATTQ